MQKQHKKDRNVMARESIVKALTELMNQKHYADITITEITQKAGVSRMTYYRNYSSKEDILRKFMQEVGEQIHAKIVLHELHKDAYQYYYTLFETLGEYATLVSATLSAGLEGLILDCVSRNMDLTFQSTPEQPQINKYVLRYHAGAFFHVFVEWIRGGRAESCEQIARLCADATTGKLGFAEFELKQ